MEGISYEDLDTPKVEKQEVLEKLAEKEIETPQVKSAKKQVNKPKTAIKKEDVVAPSVEGKPTVINTDKGNFLKLNTEIAETTNNKDVFGYEILDDENNNIGNIELIDLTSYDYYKEQGIDGFIVTNVKTKNRGEGIGRDAYKSLILNSEKRIFSDTARTEDANKMWNSLVKDGFAEYDEKLDRYVSIKPTNEATPPSNIIPNTSIRPTTPNVVEVKVIESNIENAEEIAKTIVSKIKEIKVKPAEEIVVPQEKQSNINLVSFETIDFTGTPTTFYKKGNKWGYLNSNGIFDSLIPNAQMKIESEYQAKKESEKAEKDSKC